jgi:hypothetical protein
MNLKTIIRRINNEIFSRIFFDKGKDKDAIYIAGAGRSGTTWLADMLSQFYNYRLIFEPFWHLHFKVEGINDFFHHRYIEPTDNSYDNYIEKVISGKFRNFWTNKNTSPGPYDGRVIKEICSNLFIERIKKVFPNLPVIFVIRHPYAVVASRLNKTNWAKGWGEHAHLFNNQDQYLKKYHGNQKFIPKSELEDHIIAYCHENFLPLYKRDRLSSLFYFSFYEKIVLEPEHEFEKILKHIETISGKKPKKKLNEITDKFRMADPSNIDYIKQDKINHLTNYNKKLGLKDKHIIDNILRKFEMFYLKEEIDNYLEKKLGNES